MAAVTVTFDPDIPAEIDRVRRLLDKLDERSDDPGTDVELLRRHVVALLAGSGPGRRDYISLVAAASPGVVTADALGAGAGTRKSLGGIHSAIERAWRAKGRSKPFIETDAAGNAYMDPALATLVVSVLRDLADGGPQAQA